MKAYMFAVLALLIASASYATPINAGTSVNASGTLYEDFAGGGSTPLSAISGMNTAGWNATTGLGSFTFTDTDLGNRFFDVFVNLDLGTAFWNEYAAFHGALAAGESAQVDTPDFDCDANRCGNIIANTNINALDNLNHVPGQLDNFLFDCGADGGGAINAACNNDVSVALGFGYMVPVGKQAVLTVTISNTAPASGFYIAQIKPLDGDNDPETVYFSGSLALHPAQTTVPEPSTLTLLTAALVGTVLRRRKR